MDLRRMVQHWKVLVMDKTLENILDRAREIYMDPAGALAKDVNLTNEGSIAAIRVALIDLFSEEQLVESEDERIRKEIIDEIKEQINNIPAPDCCDSDDLKRLATLKSWIAYLEKKPAEWSEEDEKMIQLLILEIDKHVFFAGIESKKIINLLKSLRPSWKPSKEQMRFLLAVINEPNNAGSESCHLVLKGLYEQLKNL